jgi:hypothetical protein
MRRLLIFALALFILGAIAAPVMAQTPAPQQQLQTKAIGKGYEV